MGNSPWVRERLDTIKQTSTCHTLLIEDRAKSLGAQLRLTYHTTVLSQGKPPNCVLLPLPVPAFLLSLPTLRYHPEGKKP